MKVRSFSHVALTVSDFNRAVTFYTDVFGCALVGVNGNHGHDRLRDFFGVDSDAPELKIGWVRVPGGATLELFEFTPSVAGEPVVWNRPGPTHISFNCRDTDKWHDHLVSRGVEIVSPPQRSPFGHTFFFAADPDGNLIEMIDIRFLRPVLRWLGPLGGAVFKRTRYRKYHRWPDAPEARRGVSRRTGRGPSSTS